MRQYCKYIVLLAIFSLSSLVTFAGQSEEKNRETAVCFITHMAPSHARVPQPDHFPVLIAQKPTLNILRVQQSPLAVETKETAPFCMNVLARAYLSPINQFEQGIFLRYRPRDPPVA